MEKKKSCLLINRTMYFYFEFRGLWTKNIACHFSKQRMLPAIPVNYKCCPQSSLQPLQLSPTVHPEGNS